MTTPNVPRRRWFRFGLRTLFVLLTVLGVWVGVQMNWLRERREARAWIEKNGGVVLDHVPHDFSIAGGKPQRWDPARVRAPWPIRLLGGEPVGFVVFHDAKGQSARLSKIFPEAKIVQIPAHYDARKSGPLSSPAKRP